MVGRQRPPEPLRGRLRHAVGTRARITLVDPPGGEDLDVIAAEAAAIPAVRSLEVRHATGSLVLRHDGPLDRVLADLSGARLLEILPPEPRSPLDPIAEAVSRFGQADRIIATTTSGRIDLSSTLFVGLVAAGLVQLARGQVLGPALTLFGQAATLALMRLSYPASEARASAASPPPRRPEP